MVQTNTVEAPERAICVIRIKGSKRPAMALDGNGRWCISIPPWARCTPSPKLRAR